MRHAFFTRLGGVSEGPYASLNGGSSTGGDTPERIAENRRRAAEFLGLDPTRLLRVRQVHGTRTVTVTEPWGIEGPPEADALVTRSPGLGLMILTADCAPVLLADPTAGIVGAAHAGWRGALAGILESVLEAMEHLGAHRTRILAAIGPCIAQNSYEVGPEVREAFVHQAPSSERFFRPSLNTEGRSLFDLPGYVAARLSAAGVTAVDPSSADTYADERRFFSYRRTTLRGESDRGNLMSAMMLNPEGC